MWKEMPLYAVIPTSDDDIGYTVLARSSYYLDLNTFWPSKLVSCPARACLPARNDLVNEVEFLGLTLQKW